MPTLSDDRQRLIAEIDRLDLSDDSDQLLFCHIFNEYFKARQMIRSNGAEWFWQHLRAEGRGKRKATG